MGTYLRELFQKEVVISHDFCQGGIFLTETKCKIRFIYVTINWKQKKWVAKCAIKGGWGLRFLYALVLLLYAFYMSAKIIFNVQGVKTVFNIC